MSATSEAGTSGAPEVRPGFGVRFFCVDRCFSLCPFSLRHCVVCSSSIYGFWLSLWYIQTLLTIWRCEDACFY